MMKIVIKMIINNQIPMCMVTRVMIGATITKVEVKVKLVHLPIFKTKAVTNLRAIEGTPD